MTTPLRFAVLGAGGVGGYYGALLARAGHPVAVLARGANLDAIRRHGLRVRTPDGDLAASVEASDDVAALGDVDVALVTVKSYSLAAIAPSAARLAAGGADIVPLLNGVEAVPRLAELGVRRERLLGGVTYISAARTAPGEFERRSPFQRVLVGEPGGGANERARRIAEAFAGAGAEARASDDIDTELWRKFVFLVAISAACGLSRTSIGALWAQPLGPLLLERAVAEAAAVACARGARLPDTEERRVMELLKGLPEAMKPSFLLDVEAGGPTELDVLSGAVSRFGRETGIETPVHDTAVAALGAASGDA